MGKQGVGAGGKLTRPVEDRFYGRRTGEVTDVFGYRWTLSTRSEDIPRRRWSGLAEWPDKLRRR